MGSLSGHLLPGSFFLLFGLWWTWAVYFKYFLALKENAQEGNKFRRRQGRLKYKNSASFPCSMCRRIPVEGIVKVTLTIVGIIGEYVTGVKDGKIIYYGNIQHLTIYMFFGLNGVADILQHFDLGLIPNLDYVTGSLAYMMEGVIFYFHLDGQLRMEARLHVFLLLVIVGTVISSVSEALYRHSVLPCLGRVYFTLLQGTWFMQIGFLLYVFHYGNKSSNQLKTVTFIFSWHIAGVFLFLLLSGYLVRYFVKHKQSTTSYEAFYMKHTKEGRFFDRSDTNLDETLIFTESDEV